MFLTFCNYASLKICHFVRQIEQNATGHAQEIVEPFCNHFSFKMYTDSYLFVMRIFGGTKIVLPFLPVCLFMGARWPDLNMI